MKLNLKKQNGAILIISCFTVAVFVLLCPLIYDMAKLSELKQSIHSQLQLSAEAGLKLYIDNPNYFKHDRATVDNGPVNWLFNHAYYDKVNQYLGFNNVMKNRHSVTIDDVKNNWYGKEKDNVDCDGKKSFQCKVTVTVDKKNLIFGKAMPSGLFKDGISFDVEAKSCYNDENGLFYFAY